MSILKVTSRDNKTLKTMRQPEKSNMILVEGPKFIQELLDADLQVEDIAVAASKLEQYEEILHRAEKSGARLIEVPDRIMSGVGDAVTGQGIVALATRPDTSPVTLQKQGMSRILVLDAIQDPGNVGAIIRSASAFGVSAVVALEGTANPFGSKAIRASAGACFHLPLILLTVDEFLHFSTEKKLYMVALDGAAETDISEHSLPPDCAIIVGNEGAGIRPEILQKCELSLKIPISEKLESLNAAIAASIALYELARERTTK